MNSLGLLDPAVLGRILLLQSTIQAAPDERHLVDMTAHALAVLPGLADCVVCVGGTVTGQTCSCDPPVFSSDPSEAEQDSASVAVRTDRCTWETYKDWQKLPLQTPKCVYGSIFLHVDDEEAFAPYLDFVSNTANLVALHIENDRNTDELNALNRDLDEQVTERARQLHESEERLSQIAETVKDVFWMTDWKTGKILFVSRAYETVWGRPLQDLYSEARSWADAIHPEDAERAWNAFAQLEEGDSYDSEYRIIRPDGSERWIRDQGFPVRDENGLVHRFAGIAQDITERKLAEEELLQSEEKYRDLVETSQNLIWRCDQEGLFTYVNPAWEDAIGYTADEMIQHHFSEFKSEEINERDLSTSQRIRDGQDTIGYETVYISKSGEPRDLVFNIRAVRDRDGNPVGTQGTAQDFTERKRAEDALKLTASRLQLATEAARIGHWDWDLRSNEVYFSPEWKRQIGYEDYELPNKLEEWETRLHPDDLEPTLQSVDDFVKGRKNEHKVEFRLRHKDGSYRWIFTRADSQCDDDGNPIRIFGCHVDITDRKRGEEERTLLMSAIEQATESVVITDVQATIQYVNPAFEQVTGYSREEAIGQNPRILQSQRHGVAFYTKMWDTLTSGKTWAGKIVNRRKDGTIFTEEATISPIRDASGKTVNYVAVKRDVTHEVQLEDQLRMAQKLESIGRLAGGVAHDLNNLLTPIIGYSEMLQQDLDPQDERLESINEIYRAGVGARDLIHQLLAFSRKQTLEFKTVDINKTITEFKGLLRGSISEDIEIETDLSPDVHTVMADVGQIEQVIMNLAVNSNDAMPHGGRLTIKTSNVPLDARFVADHPGATVGEHVLLAVIDTGYGMDAMTREHAFEPFYSTKGHQGTGLGLATVYGIVKQHEGYISVDSELGKGTAVNVYLPVSKSESAEYEPSKPPVSELKGVETVLLVEDYEPLRILAQTVLKRQGYTVLMAEGGPEALTLLEKHDGPLHLLLTDVVMPKMSGKELSDLALEKQPGMKVLFMSGYSEDEISHRGVLNDNTAFIQKPFTVEGLAAKVREVLENGQ